MTSGTGDVEILPFPALDVPEDRRSLAGRTVHALAIASSEDKRKKHTCKDDKLSSMRLQWAV